MSIGTAPLLRGKATQSAAADNATATATVAAVANQKHLVLGVEAHYDAAVSTFQTVTIKHGSTTWITHRWDFSNGPFIMNYPVALLGSNNEAVSAELQASGAGGTDGYVILYTALD
jgi:hypothetical protein